MARYQVYIYGSHWNSESYPGSGTTPASPFYNQRVDLRLQVQGNHQPNHESYVVTGKPQIFHGYEAIVTLAAGQDLLLGLKMSQAGIVGHCYPPGPTRAGDEFEIYATAIAAASLPAPVGAGTQLGTPQIDFARNSGPYSQYPGFYGAVFINVNSIDPTTPLPILVGARGTIESNESFGDWSLAWVKVTRDGPAISD